MARILARTLTLARSAPTSLRGLATKVEVVDIDLSEEDAAAAPSSQESTVDIARIRRLMDAVHGLRVRSTAPAWLPFVPGGSFWVPPVRPPPVVAELMDGIAEAGLAEGVVGGDAVELVQLDLPMTEEQALSFSTARGWPSACYFVEGKFPRSRKKTWKDAIQIDDEES